MAVRSRFEVPAQAPEFVLVQALPKGDRGPLAVDLATELGVDRIMPWAASRCVTRWRDDRIAKGVAKWRSAAHAASKQSRRPRVPEVTEPMTTREVCGLLGDADLAVVLHEQARRPLAELEIPRTAPSWSSSAPRAGSPTARSWPSAPPVRRPCGSGAEVLRTSTAGAAALAALSMRTRWPDTRSSGPHHGQVRPRSTVSQAREPRRARTLSSSGDRVLLRPRRTAGARTRGGSSGVCPCSAQCSR